MSQLQVDAVTTYEGFLELEPIWNPLLMRSDTDTVFLTFEWLTTWWRCFGGDAELLVLVVRRGGEPVALAPLIVAHEPNGGRWPTQVRFLANTYSMRANFILTESAQPALEAIFDYLASAGPAWDRMKFDYMPEDSTAHRLAPAACRRAHLRWGVLPSLISPYLVLAGADWDEMLAGINSGFRRALVQSERRVLSRESGRTVICCGRDTLEYGLAACRQVALTTWQHARGSSIASSDVVWEFYRSLAAVAADRGWLRIGVLEAHNQPIAFAYALLYHDVLYELKIGYHPGFRNLSPGHVLKAAMIRDALAVGALAWDMLGVNDDYKMQWAPRVRRHNCLCIAGPGVKQALGHWVTFGVKPRLRRWPPARAIKRWIDARGNHSHDSGREVVRYR